MREWLERFPGHRADSETTGATFFRIGGGIVPLHSPSSPLLSHSAFRVPPKRGPPSHFIEGKRKEPRTDSNGASRDTALPPPPPPLVMEGRATFPQSPAYLTASPRTAATPPLTQLVGHRGCLSLLWRLEGRRVRGGSKGKAKQGRAWPVPSPLPPPPPAAGGGERRQLPAAQSRKRSSPSSRLSPGFDHI